MIEFRGELSGKNKKLCVITNQKVSMLIATIVCLISAIPITLVVVYKDPMFAIMYLCLAVFFIAFSFPTPKKKLNMICPSEITITDDELNSICKGANHTRQIENVRKIIDHGDCYQIFFRFPNTSFIFVCQKDLIVQGSIEEFEEMFADKIVRKYKK